MEKSHTGHRQRLRQRYLKNGIETFHDYEMLELLLTYSIPRVDVKPLAKEILREFGTLNRVFTADTDKLRKIKGISDNSLVLIKLVQALGGECLLSELRQKQSLSSPLEVVNFCRMKLGGLENEVFMVIYLNSKNSLIEAEIINRGTVNHAAVYPRNVMKNALTKNAVSLIIVHNHPSGECSPSAEDLNLTNLMKEAAKTVGLRILDHLIVSSESYFSFSEENIL